MSYDLYFKSRTASQPLHADFAAYFSGRDGYRFQGGQALYSNEDTGVYFNFENNNGEDGSAQTIAFNMNYYRPSYFALEAEPEVHAFVRALDLVVSDPQINGMGEGEYNSDLFHSGWRAGNEFGIHAILGHQKKPDIVYSRPMEDLHRIWRWNSGRKQYQSELGDKIFVPRVMFLRTGNEASSAVVWPDGAPTIIPEVEYLIVVRNELAPRRLLSKKNDVVFLERGLADKILSRYGSTDAAGTTALTYKERPNEVISFVRSLKTSAEPKQGLAPDQVLDRELVGKWRS